MTTADTSVLPSQMLEKSSAAIVQTVDAQAFLIQHLEKHLMQQRCQRTDSRSYMCEWVPTNLRLPLLDSKKEDTYLCLPGPLSEDSFFKQNEEKEEYKDDEDCATAATRLRLMALDNYLSSLAPLALSTKKLLCGESSIQDSDSSHRHCGFTTLQDKSHLKRRSKYDRQFQLLMHQPALPLHRLVNSTNSGRVLNVIQGEIAHCTPAQADTLISDDATTCHIVALWSCCPRSKGGETTEAASRSVLATMAHIDGAGYEASIREAVNEHIEYHRSQHHDCSYADQAHAGSTTVEMSIHFMGGFNDHDGSSIKITDDILQTFASLSNRFNEYSISRRLPRVRMTLETCAVSSANDDGSGRPLGRGLAMEVATGKIFLAEVDDAGMHESLRMPQNTMLSSINDIGMVAVDGDAQPLHHSGPDYDITAHPSAQGPGVILRSTRLWASAFYSRGGERKNRLHIIYRPNSEYLCIEPFFFAPHPSAKGLLHCDDAELLQITSTSPDVEKPNFVSKVRESLSYMNGTMSSRVFTARQPVAFRRIGLNGWVRTS